MVMDPDPEKEENDAQTDQPVAEKAAVEKEEVVGDNIGDDAKVEGSGGPGDDGNADGGGSGKAGRWRKWKS